jgi:hypothetical protein
MDRIVEWSRKELERKIELLKLLGTGDMKISETQNGEMKDTTEERKLALDNDIKALGALIDKYGN